MLVQVEVCLVTQFNSDSVCAELSWLTHYILFNMFFNENEKNYVKMIIPPNIKNHAATKIVHPLANMLKSAGEHGEHSASKHQHVCVVISSTQPL